mgnify:CR=1 FL=1
MHFLLPPRQPRLAAGLRLGVSFQGAHLWRSEESKVGNRADRQDAEIFPLAGGQGYQAERVLHQQVQRAGLSDRTLQSRGRGDPASFLDIS